MLPIEHLQVVYIPLSGQHPDEGQKSCTHDGKTRQHGAVWAAATTDSRSINDNQCAECSCTVRYPLILFSKFSRIHVYSVNTQSRFLHWFNIAFFLVFQCIMHKFLSSALPDIILQKMLFNKKLSKAQSKIAKWVAF